MLIALTLALAVMIALLATIPASAPVTGGPATFGYNDSTTWIDGMASGGGNLVPLW
jgi:hypothetical protein